MKKKYWITSLFIILALIIIAIFSFSPFINYLGKRELYIFAKDKNYCHSDSCEEGIAFVTQALHKKSGIPPENVPWCMATNLIYYQDWYAFNGIKVKFVDWMYQTCERDELTLEDANIQIGESHEH
ncbi:hypothetical protein MEG_00718 [Bartonella tamiae Th307]|uniref:Uncharacterized protein n=2 Tax=Bartonella tamiae TaxID=373638 RepID=J0ZJW6_9HYPH|nr:hypothetical protein ME5_01164 [Bartonella tamiae Th239]EJF95137.1 hypothetical protein MEG_00718 [Bartonella tamiae Th307]